MPRRYSQLNLDRVLPFFARKCAYAAPIASFDGLCSLISKLPDVKRHPAVEEVPRGSVKIDRLLLLDRRRGIERISLQERRRSRTRQFVPVPAWCRGPPANVSMSSSNRHKQ